MDQTYKHDGSKLRWDLIPWETLDPVVRVLMCGAEKYTESGYQLVRPFRARYFAATLRHLFAWWRGEKIDPEFGEPHIAHAICNLIFLMWGDQNEIDN